VKLCTESLKNRMFVKSKFGFEEKVRLKYMEVCLDSFIGKRGGILGRPPLDPGRRVGSLLGHCRYVNLYRWLKKVRPGQKSFRVG
jgi:hypothetical protein